MFPRIIKIFRRPPVVRMVKQGPAGPPGADGQDGADGATGPQGPPGTTEWSGITGKPGTFPPEAHTHAISDVAGLGSALTARPPAIVEMNPATGIPLTNSTGYIHFGWGTTPPEIQINLYKPGAASEQYFVSNTETPGAGKWVIPRTGLDGLDALEALVDLINEHSAIVTAAQGDEDAAEDNRLEFTSQGIGAEMNQITQAVFTNNPGEYYVSSFNFTGGTSSDPTPGKPGQLFVQTGAAAWVCVQESPVTWKKITS